MIEITKTIYQAEDGKQFLSREECLKYEAKELIKKYNDIYKYCEYHCEEEAGDFYGHNVCINDCCPFYSEVKDYNCVFRCIPYRDLPKMER
jgi:hypothetical protein